MHDSAKVLLCVAVGVAIGGAAREDAASSRLEPADQAPNGSDHAISSGDAVRATTTGRVAR